MNFAKKLIGGFLLSSVALCTAAQAAPEQNQDFSAIEQQLHKMIPGADSFNIQQTGVKGLYQVILGVDVIYMSKDGQFLVQGDLIDLKNKVNLTRQVTLKERTRALSEIPEDSMLIYPGADDAKQKTAITVFTDLNCPYCKKLHLDVPKLNEAGITVRYLAYPRAGIGSESYKEAVSVWCADKPLEAMDMAMRGKPVESKQCDNPVKQHMSYAQLFQVNGTPNILLEDGTMVPGYVPAKKLIKEIYSK